MRNIFELSSHITSPRIKSIAIGFALAFRAVFADLKACAVWRWWSRYERKCHDTVPAKRLLRLNIDETSLCVFQGDMKGTIFPRSRGARTIKQQVPRGKRRRNITFSCVVCDDAAIQQKLPQFLIGNHVTFAAKEMRPLRSQCASNFELLRERSAWSNETLFMNMLRRIRSALNPFMDDVQPVLFLDCARLHLTGTSECCVLSCFISFV